MPMIGDDGQTRHCRSVISIDDAASQLDGISVVELLRSASSCARPPPDFTYGPITAEALRHFHNDQNLPPVAIYTMRDVEVIGPWFITGALLVRGDVDFRCDWISLNPDSDESRKRLAQHVAALASGEKTRRHVQGQTLLLANNGHQIYGHWLVDFLPKLYLLEVAGVDIDRIKILVPSNMGDFGRTFLHLLGFPEDRLVRHDPDKETIVSEELIVPTTLRQGGRCSPLFADAIAYINERIDRCNRVPCSQHRRLFISRRKAADDWRPFLNQDSIEAMAVEAGFAAIHPERLPLLDQIALFRGARRIAGQYGSGLHATIFSRPGVVVGGLHGQLPATFDALQSGIGERLGQPTGYVFATPQSGQDNPWAITVDEADFGACLNAQFAN